MALLTATYSLADDGLAPATVERVAASRDGRIARSSVPLSTISDFLEGAGKLAAASIAATEALDADVVFRVQSPRLTNGSTRVIVRFAGLEASAAVRSGGAEDLVLLALGPSSFESRPMPRLDAECLVGALAELPVVGALGAGDYRSGTVCRHVTMIHSGVGLSGDPIDTSHAIARGSRGYYTSAKRILSIASELGVERQSDAHSRFGKEFSAAVVGRIYQMLGEYSYEYPGGRPSDTDSTC
ncbi:MAG: hypothetical protein O2855_04385 [Planctomycetota bacterium]|nr:hypothetical protein [Planctomycetota bacterium]